MCSWLIECTAAHPFWPPQPSVEGKNIPQQEWGWYKRVITGNQGILAPSSWLFWLITGPPEVKGKKKGRLAKVHTQVPSGPKSALLRSYEEKNGQSIGRQTKVCSGTGLGNSTVNWKFCLFLHTARTRKTISHTYYQKIWKCFCTLVLRQVIHGIHAPFQGSQLEKNALGKDLALLKCLHEQCKCFD